MLAEPRLRECAGTRLLVALRPRGLLMGWDPLSSCPAAHVNEAWCAERSGAPKFGAAGRLGSQPARPGPPSELPRTLLDGRATTLGEVPQGLLNAAGAVGAAGLGESSRSDLTQCGSRAAKI